VPSSRSIDWGEREIGSDSELRMGQRLAIEMPRAVSRASFLVAT
jgi:hypothetical protein